MSDVFYGSINSRNYKTLGMYLVAQTWFLQADCVAISSKCFKNFCGITTMRKSRLKDIIQELEQYFPNVRCFLNKGTDIVSVVFLSRFEFPELGMQNCMSTPDRIQLLAGLGLKSVSVTLPSEEQMVTELSLLSNGLVYPKQILGK